MHGNGHVIPSTPIAIDMWNTKSHPQARIFFLSHFHADHIVGLNSSWQYPIYTSPITAKFLIRILKVSFLLLLLSYKKYCHFEIHITEHLNIHSSPIVTNYQ